MVVALPSVLPVTAIHPGGVRNDSTDSDVKGIKANRIFVSFLNINTISCLGPIELLPIMLVFLGAGHFLASFCLSSASPKRAPLDCAGDASSS